MKNLYNYICEASLLDIDSAIKMGDDIEEHSNLVALWKKNYINFNVFIKERFMKDAKSYKHKTGPQYDYGIDGFNSKKKYFFIVKNDVRYDMNHPLAKQYPKLAKFTYTLYINDDEGNIGSKMLVDYGRGNIDIDIAYYNKRGNYYPMHNYKTSVGNFMFDYGKNKTDVYEVPKQYEWLYDYIKEKKIALDMKSLKEMCSINTSNSLHSVLEASILDIEGTIKAGDDYANTYKLAEQELFKIFKDLDKFKVWKKYLSTGIEFKRNNCCANLCKILGNEKANSIRIAIMELGLNSYHVYIWLYPDNVKNEYQHWQVSRAKIYAPGKNIKEALQVFILTYRHIFSDVKAFEYFVKADEHKGDKWI